MRLQKLSYCDLNDMTSTTIKKIYTVPHFYVQCTAWNWIKAEIDYEGTAAQELFHFIILPID